MAASSSAYRAAAVLRPNEDARAAPSLGLLLQRKGRLSEAEAAYCQRARP